MVKRLADEFSEVAAGHPLPDVIDAAGEILLNAILRRSRDIEHAIEHVAIAADMLVLTIIDNIDDAKAIMEEMSKDCTVISFQDHPLVRRH